MQSIAIQYQVKNPAALQQMFEDIEFPLFRGLAREALSEGANPMVAAIRSGIRSRSGLLARSVKARAGKNDRPGTFSVIVSTMATASQFIKNREAAGFVSLSADLKRRYDSKSKEKYSVYYGYMVDSGHLGPHGSSAATPSHPFFRLGFDSTVDESANMIETRLLDAITSQ